MLIRNITYENGDGITVTEKFEFNLNAREVLKLIQGDEEEIKEEDLKNIDVSKLKKLATQFDDFILSSYGVRSEDRKRFIKSDELRKEFSDSFAYDALFMELAGNEIAAGEFLMGVVPKNMKEELIKAQELNRINAIPPPQDPS